MMKKIWNYNPFQVPSKKNTQQPNPDLDEKEWQSVISEDEQRIDFQKKTDDQLTQLEKKLQVAEQIKSENQKTIQQLSDNLNKLRIGLELAQTNNDHLHQSEAQLQKQIAALKEKLAEIEQDRSRIIAKLTDTNLKIEALQKALENKEAVLREATRKNFTLRKDLDARITENKSIQSESASLKHELTDIRKTKKEQNAMLFRLHNTIDQLEKEKNVLITSHQTAFENLQKENQQLDKCNKELIQKLQEQENVNKQLHEENISLQQKTSKKNSDVYPLMSVVVEKVEEKKHFDAKRNKCNYNTRSCTLFPAQQEYPAQRDVSNKKNKNLTHRRVCFGGSPG